MVVVYVVEAVAVVYVVETVAVVYVVETVAVVKLHVGVSNSYRLK